MKKNSAGVQKHLGPELFELMEEMYAQFTCSRLKKVRDIVFHLLLNYQKI
jgi:hypothetical protein